MKNLMNLVSQTTMKIVLQNAHAPQGIMSQLYQESVSKVQVYLFI